MATEMTILKEKGLIFKEQCDKAVIANETDRASGGIAILLGTERIQQIKKLGAVPIKAAKDNLVITKAHFDSIAEPYTYGVNVLSAKLGKHFMIQRKAQEELQREEMERANAEGTAPEIVVGEARTQKSEEGSVTMRLIKTFDFGMLIVDGKGVGDSPFSGKRCNAKLTFLS